MKIGVFILVLLFFISTSSALTIVSNDNYEAKETALVKITGVIYTPLVKEQIELKRGHISVPIEYDVARIGEDSYIWFVTPETEGNYSLLIKGVSTAINGKQASLDFEKNFTVSNKFSEYSITPGFVITKKNFTIEAYLYSDEKKEIEINYPQKGLVMLEPGKNYLKFDSQSFNNSGIYFIQIGKYQVVIDVTVERKGSNGEPIIENEYDLEFFPHKIERIILDNSQPVYFVEIRNYGHKITNASLVYNDYIFNSSEKVIDELDRGQNRTLNLSLKSNNHYINEVIILRVEGKTFSLPVIINYTTNLEELTNQTGNNEVYCAELGGIICSSGTTCNQSTITTTRGACCVSRKCVASGSSGWGSAIGYLLIALLIIGGIYAYYRYSNTKNNKNPIQEMIKKDPKGIP
jgi:hypothetical protein